MEDQVRLHRVASPIFRRNAEACGMRLCPVLGKRWVARRPVSRVLFPRLSEGDDHSSRTTVTGRLVQPTRTAARKPAYLSFLRRAVPIWSCSRWGLPCRRCCRRRGALLPHPFTLTNLRQSVGGRFSLCGTVPRVAPAGCYPAPCFRGARTFLSPKGERPSGRLAEKSIG